MTKEMRTRSPETSAMRSDATRNFAVIGCSFITNHRLDQVELAYKEIESPGKLFFFSNLGIGCVLVL